MKLRRLLFCAMLFCTCSFAQEIYVVNNVNEIKVIDVTDFSVTSLFGISIQEAGFITDLAFAPDGRLFGVTNEWTLIEIDLVNEDFTLLAQLPTGDSYTALVCNSTNELFTARYLNMELYKYNLDTDEVSFVENGISSPGDFTYYKGNLVYPNFFNDFIKAYDGTSTKEIGCSVPLLWSFVNVFEDCETNTIYAIDQFAKVYLYDLETEDYELVADLVAETGPLYGGATTTEYMASACPTVPLEEVSCEILSVSDFNPYGISTYPNPVSDKLYVSVTSPLDNLDYSLYDVKGYMVASGDVSTIPISMAQLSSGIYFFTVRDFNGMTVFQKKILKK